MHQPLVCQLQEIQCILKCVRNPMSSDQGLWGSISCETALINRVQTAGGRCVGVCPSDWVFFLSEGMALQLHHLGLVYNAQNFV